MSETETKEPPQMLEGETVESFRVRCPERSADLEKFLVSIFRNANININSIDDLGKNYDKPRPCKMCRKDYVCPRDAWGQGESDWELCSRCGVEREKSRMQVPKRFRDANIVEDFKQFTWEQREVLIKSSSWIYGPAGTGKTHLGFAIAHWIIEMDRKHICFAEFNDVAQELEGAHKPFKWLSKSQILEKYTKPEVLFLDDVFGSKKNDEPSENENRALFEIVRERNNQKLQTVITSNYDLEQLEKKGFNPRTTSRIAELCKVVNLDGADRRLTVVKDEVQA